MTRTYPRLAFAAVLLFAPFSRPIIAQQAAAPVAAAQPAAAKLAFDVASVRPSPQLDPAAVQAAMQAGKGLPFGVKIEGSRAEYDYMGLRDLIGIAYNVKPYQISGPDWLTQQGQRFNIVAKMPDGATKDDAPAMLKTLLEDRFKLVAHQSTEERSAVALVAAKGGPKMKESAGAAQPLDPNAELKPGQMKVDMGDGPAIVTINKDGTSTTNMGARGSFTQKLDMSTQTLHLDATNLTMDGLADLLTRVMTVGGPGPQVVNQTGIQGSFDISLNLSLADIIARARANGMNIPGGPGGGGGGGGMGEASDPSGNSTVYSSVQALGLKLESRKAQVMQLVIDHVEKDPTEN